MELRGQVQWTWNNSVNCNCKGTESVSILLMHDAILQHYIPLCPTNHWLQHTLYECNMSVICTELRTSASGAYIPNLDRATLRESAHTGYYLNNNKPPVTHICHPTISIHLLRGPNAFRVSTKGLWDFVFEHHFTWHHRVCATQALNGVNKSDVFHRHNIQCIGYDMLDAFRTLVLHAKVSHQPRKLTSAISR